MKNCQNMGVSHNISLSFLIVSMSGKHLLDLSTDSTSHFEFSITENVSLTNGEAKLFFDILTFRCLEICDHPLISCQFSTY